MTRREDGFLKRCEWRKASHKLTQQIIFGFLVSFGSLGVGAFKYFISIDAWDTFWLAVMWFGGMGILVTLIVPWIWGGFEKMIHSVGNRVGGMLMISILSLLYFFVVWPVGMLLRFMRGSHPIYQWKGSKQKNMEGWSDKMLPYDLLDVGERKNSYLKKWNGFINVMYFFIRRGNFIFIPVLIIMISLGVVLFFLQTSALAPMIYTLF